MGSIEDLYGSNKDDGLNETGGRRFIARWDFYKNHTPLWIRCRRSARMVGKEEKRLMPRWGGPPHWNVDSRSMNS